MATIGPLAHIFIPLFKIRFTPRRAARS